MEIDKRQMQKIFEKIMNKMLNNSERRKSVDDVYANWIRRYCENELQELSQIGVNAKWLKENGQINEIPIGIVNALPKYEVEMWEERWS